jgi:2-dehydropantoate 2-reductase
MKSIQSVLLAGAGAVGLTVADTLRCSDAAGVSVLAGGERAERYRRDGLWVNGERLELPVTQLGDTPQAAPDLIIIACKATQLEQVAADIGRHVGSGTLILSLLNGISSEELLGRLYGAERLPLAYIIATDAQREGSRVTYKQKGVVHFGDAAGRETERDARIAEYFTRAGLPFEYHRSDMRRSQWFKFMVNAGVNPVSAMLRLPYGPFKRGAPGIAEAREILESAMREVIALSRCEGVNLEEADIEGWYQALSKLDDAGYTSMAQDVLAGRRTEIDLFAGTVMALSAKHGIEAPVNTLLYRAIRVIEQL